ncbi:MAG: thiamine phosphate synthase [Candidatus Dadabacteria bacterium]|nr:MAG: thiamine phosphate synthase [Candidatus Dadabacteria bacterium]
MAASNLPAGPDKVLMETVVISKPFIFDGEAVLLSRLFEAGLECFHLRKPEESEENIRTFLEGIPPEHRKKIVIHNHLKLFKDYQLGGVHISGIHRDGLVEALKDSLPGLLSTSVHTLAELKALDGIYRYVFFSPVFKSISKKDYGPSGDLDDVVSYIRDKDNICPVYALGGVSAKNIFKVGELGFSGAALCGAVWASDDPVSEFCKIRDLCH